MEAVLSRYQGRFCPRILTLGVQECDMEETMKVEAKDFVATFIEKSSGADGVDF